MNPTQSDTPLTDAMESCVKQYAIPQFELLLHARALEIETQELAEALCQMLLVISKQNIEAPGITKARVTLARHRAKQEGSK